MFLPERVTTALELCGVAYRNAVLGGSGIFHRPTPLITCVVETLCAHIDQLVNSGHLKRESVSAFRSNIKDANLSLMLRSRNSASQ